MDCVVLLNFENPVPGQPTTVYSLVANYQKEAYILSTLAHSEDFLENTSSCLKYPGLKSGTLWGTNQGSSNGIQILRGLAKNLSPSSWLINDIKMRVKKFQTHMNIQLFRRFADSYLQSSIMLLGIYKIREAGQIDWGNVFHGTIERLGKTSLITDWP